MKDGSIGLPGEGRSADSFPAKSANALFRDDAAPRLEEELSVGSLKVLRE